MGCPGQVAPCQSCSGDSALGVLGNEEVKGGTKASRNKVSPLERWIRVRPGLVPALHGFPKGHTSRVSQGDTEAQEAAFHSSLEGRESSLPVDVPAGQR